MRYFIWLLLSLPAAAQCSSWGPPNYPCSNPGTAVIQTPNNPPFSGANGYNQVAYDLSINPRWVDVFLRTSDATMVDGHSLSVTASGGDNDRIFSCTGRLETTACKNATVYFQIAVYNGCPYMEAIKFIGGLPTVVGPFPAHINTNVPNHCSSLQSSFSDPTIWYQVYSNSGDPTISKVTYAWDGTVGDSPTIANENDSFYDVGANCPLPGGTGFNVQYLGSFFPSALDNQFYIAMSNVIPLNNGTDTASVTNGLATFTLTGSQALQSDGSLNTQVIVIGGVNYNILSINSGGLSGTLTTNYTGTTASGVAVHIDGGQNSVAWIVNVQISPAGCQVWNTVTGQITASGVLPGGPITSSCLGMKQHDGIAMMDGKNVENSGASTGTNCGVVHNFWGMGTLNDYPCNAMMSSPVQSACNGHEAGGYHNFFLTNNPFMLILIPEQANTQVVTPIGQYPASAPLNCENHGSWTHATAGDTQPIFIGTANNNFSTSGTTSTYVNPYFNENYMLRQDGTTARIGHNFVLGPGNAAGCGTSNIGPFDSQFRSSNGITATSPDGRLYAVQSSMLGTLGNGACQSTNNCLDVDGQVRTEIIDGAIDNFVPVAATRAVAAF